MPDTATDTKEFLLRFGAMSPPISEQLEAQNIKFDPEACVLWERASDAITFLAVHGYLTDRERQKANNRLFNRINKAL